MRHDRLTAAEPEARPQLLIARERVGRAASLECSLAELDALDAAVARVTADWSRDRRVALALRVQKEARQAGHIRGRAAFVFLLARYEHLAQAPPVAEPGRPEPERQLPVARPDTPALQPAPAPCEPGATDPVCTTSGACRATAGPSRSGLDSAAGPPHCEARADPDRPPSRPVWLTVEEAAQVLETTREGVHSRAKRGTVQSRRGDDGILRVLVDPASPPRRSPQRSPGRPSDRPSRGLAGRRRPARPPADQAGPD